MKKSCLTYDCKLATIESNICSILSLELDNKCNMAKEILPLWNKKIRSILKNVFKSLVNCVLILNTFLIKGNIKGLLITVIFCILFIHKLLGFKNVSQAKKDLNKQVYRIFYKKPFNQSQVIKQILNCIWSLFKLSNWIIYRFKYITMLQL